MNKDLVLALLSELEDDVQELRESGEGDLRTVIYKIGEVIRKVEKEETV